MVLEQKNYKGAFHTLRELKNPYYRALTSISRCLHLDDVQESFQNKRLVSQPIKNTKFHSLKRVKVIWFAPTERSSNQNNFYGNVSFSIDWNTILELFGAHTHIYLIDQATHNLKSFSRLLLTNRVYNELIEFTEELLASKTMPLKKSKLLNKYYHADSCTCIKGEGTHELQIGIEDTSDNYAGVWLFNNCSITPNNHSKVNMERKNTTIYYSDKKYLSYKCYKFNTAQNMLCPYPYDKKRSLLEVQKIKSLSSTSISDSPESANLHSKAKKMKYSIDDSKEMKEEMTEGIRNVLKKSDLNIETTIADNNVFVDLNKESDGCEGTISYYQENWSDSSSENKKQEYPFENETDRKKQETGSDNVSLYSNTTKICDELHEFDKNEQLNDASYVKLDAFEEKIAEPLALLANSRSDNEYFFSNPSNVFTPEYSDVEIDDAANDEKDDDAANDEKDDDAADDEKDDDAANDEKDDDAANDEKDDDAADDEKDRHVRLYSNILDVSSNIMVRETRTSNESLMNEEINSHFLISSEKITEGGVDRKPESRRDFYIIDHSLEDDNSPGKSNIEKDKNEFNKSDLQLEASFTDPTVPLDLNENNSKNQNVLIHDDYALSHSMLVNFNENKLVDLSNDLNDVFSCESNSEEEITFDSFEINYDRMKSRILSDSASLLSDTTEFYDVLHEFDEDDHSNYSHLVEIDAEEITAQSLGQMAKYGSNDESMSSKPSKIFTHKYCEGGIDEKDQSVVKLNNDKFNETINKIEGEQSTANEIFHSEETPPYFHEFPILPKKIIEGSVDRLTDNLNEDNFQKNSNGRNSLKDYASVTHNTDPFEQDENDSTIGAVALEGGGTATLTETPSHGDDDSFDPKYKHSVIHDEDLSFFSLSVNSDYEQLVDLSNEMEDVFSREANSKNLFDSDLDRTKLETGIKSTSLSSDSTEFHNMLDEKDYWDSATAVLDQELNVHWSTNTKQFEHVSAKGCSEKINTKPTMSTYMYFYEGRDTKIYENDHYSEGIEANDYSKTKSIDVTTSLNIKQPADMKENSYVDCDRNSEIMDVQNKYTSRNDEKHYIVSNSEKNNMKPQILTVEIDNSKHNKEISKLFEEEKIVQMLQRMNIDKNESPRLPFSNSLVRSKSESSLEIKNHSLAFSSENILPADCYTFPIQHKKENGMFIELFRIKYYF